MSVSLIHMFILPMIMRNSWFLVGVMEDSRSGFSTTCAKEDNHYAIYFSPRGREIQDQACCRWQHHSPRLLLERINRLCETFDLGDESDRQVQEGVDSCI